MIVRTRDFVFGDAATVLAAEALAGRALRNGPAPVEAAVDVATAAAGSLAGVGVEAGAPVLALARLRRVGRSRRRNRRRRTGGVEDRRRRRVAADVAGVVAALTVESLAGRTGEVSGSSAVLMNKKIEEKNWIKSHQLSET